MGKVALDSVATLDRIIRGIRWVERIRGSSGDEQYPPTTRGMDIVAVKVTSSVLSENDYYAGVFVTRNTEGISDLWFSAADEAEDTDDCVIVEINDGTLSENSQYIGYVAGVLSDAFGEDEGKTLVIVQAGGSVSSLFDDASGHSITTGTYAAVPSLLVNLPSAGTYLIMWSASVIVQVSALGTGSNNIAGASGVLYNVTAGAAINSTARYTSYVYQTGVAMAGTASGHHRITVAAPTTIQVYAARHTGTGIVYTTCTLLLGDIAAIKV